MRLKPTKQQLQFAAWELGVFFHFGIRTFHDGHKDWDYAPMALDEFNPTDLDCDQWIQTSKEAGARYAILVAKHHDGFANWPSRYTQYSVANTPWKKGKGDVVKEFTDACRKYGLAVGIYYSPAEFGLKSPGRSAKDYDDYFINQISELLTNYGKIDYLWFDGNGSAGHQYDTKRIIGCIRSHQPEILIFNMWDPDTRWVGNESGVAPSPCFNVINEIEFSISENDRQDLDRKFWMPAECDCRIRLQNWFYSDKDAHTLKSVEELMGLYDYSVGRGCNLLVNIGPDHTGKLPERDAQRFIQFGQAVQRKYGHPAVTGESFQREGNRFVCKLEKPGVFYAASLEEDISQGETIAEFRIWANPFSYGAPILVYSGTSVGHKAICNFPGIRTNQVTIEITKTLDEEDYALKDISLFGEFPEV